MVRQITKWLKYGIEGLLLWSLYGLFRLIPFHFLRIIFYKIIVFILTKTNGPIIQKNMLAA
jgi:hypothetical protein